MVHVCGDVEEGQGRNVCVCVCVCVWLWIGGKTRAGIARDTTGEISSE